MTSTVPYGVYFHDARIREVRLGVDRRLIYDFSSLPVICHAGRVREVYSYAAHIVVHDVSNFEVSVAWRDDYLVLGAQVDGRDETEADAAAFLTDPFKCTRFGLVFLSGRFECMCTKLAVQLGERGRMVEAWTED
jgi:hypothetical protein